MAAASGPRHAPVRDNRNLGKRSMTENMRLVPSVGKNLGEPNYYSDAVYRSCGKRHRNSHCQGITEACSGCGPQGHRVRNC